MEGATELADASPVPLWSAVNQLIDKRMSKQQMRWDPRSAHLLLQVRVRVIDGQLRDDFARGYPGFPSNDSTLSLTPPNQTLTYPPLELLGGRAACGVYRSIRRPASSPPSNFATS